MYTTSIADICMKNHVLFHRFADDTQLYVSYNPMMSDELENAKQLIIQCIAEIRAWMLLHQLKLNNEKTEFIVLQSPHNLLWQPQLGATWANIDIYGRSEKSGLLL